MTDTLTEDELRLARRALGLDNSTAKGKSYRNRYITGEKTHRWQSMVDRQLATYSHGVYSLTRKGAEAALMDGETLCLEDFPND